MKQNERGSHARTKRSGFLLALKSGFQMGLRALIVVSLAVFVDGSASGQDPISSDSSLAFKRFLSNPPAIERISFKLHRPGPSADSNGFVHYVGRYTTNGFVLCQVSPGHGFPPNYFSQEVPSLYTCWGNYGREYWSIRNRLVQFWSDDGKLAKDAANPMYMTVMVGRWMLAEAMNLGINQIDIGSVKWVADKFTAARTFPRHESDITGELSVSNGRPVSLRVDYGGFLYVIEYSYHDSKPLSAAGIPNVAEMFLIKDGARTQTSHIELTELVLATNSLGAELFSKDQFSRQNLFGDQSQGAGEAKMAVAAAKAEPEGAVRQHQRPSTVIYTNNQRIAFAGTNRTIMPAPYQVDANAQNKRGILVIAMMVLVVLFPFALWIMKRQPNRL